MLPLGKERRRYQQQKEMGFRQMISAHCRRVLKSRPRLKAQNVAWPQLASETPFGPPRSSML